LPYLTHLLCELEHVTSAPVFFSTVKDERVEGIMGISTTISYLEDQPFKDISWRLRKTRML
jgi:hypothetical protein